MSNPKDIDVATRLAAMELKARRVEEYLDEHRNTVNEHEAYVVRAASTATDTNKALQQHIQKQEALSEQQQITSTQHTKHHKWILMAVGALCLMNIVLLVHVLTH